MLIAAGGVWAAELLGPGPLWQHPEWLFPGAAGLFLGALALGLGRRRGRRRGRVLLGGRVPAPSARGGGLLLAALAALAVALAGPRLGVREIRAPSTGVDVAILFDVSRSMEASDTPPSRLDRARRLAGRVLAALEPGDRAALAAFGGHGVALTPLTGDLVALAEMLPAVDTELMSDRSSDLEAGLDAALRALDPTGDGGARSPVPQRPKVVLLLSDGEATGGEAPDASGAARAVVRVVAVGLGTEEGALLRDDDRVLRDASGRPVVSRRHPAVLWRMARVTGGVYRPADRWGEVDVAELVADLRRGAGLGGEKAAADPRGAAGERTAAGKNPAADARAAADRRPAAGESTAADPGAAVGEKAGAAEVALRRVPAVRVAPFAALALVLLSLEALPRRRPGTGTGGAASGAATAGGGTGRRRGGSPEAPAAPERRAWRAPLRQRVPLALALLLAGAAGAPAEAPDLEVPPAPDPGVLEARLREDPGDARALLWLGLARARRGEGAEALRAFAAAAASARDPELAALAAYDLGVAALEAGQLERARDAFLDALALAPEDPRARFNLEWTLKALAEREARAAAAPGPKTRGGARGGEGPAAAGTQQGASESTGTGAGAAPAAAGAGAPGAEAPAEESPGSTAAAEATAKASDPAEAPPQDGAEASLDPAPAGRSGLAETGPNARPLSPAEVRRWLEAVQDDPGRALRAAARRAEERSAARDPEPGAEW